MTSNRPLILVLVGLGLLLVPLAAAQSSDLVIRDPKYDLDDYDVQTAQDAKHGDYLYTRIGKQAVCIAGPRLGVTDGDLDALFRLSGEKIEVVNPRQYSADGYRVRVNERLQYLVEGDDFEYEVGLAEVRLVRSVDAIRSDFTFVGAGDGVAHRLTISAIVDGKTVRTTSPFSIEARDEAREGDPQPSNDPSVPAECSGSTGGGLGASLQNVPGGPIPWGIGLGTVAVAAGSFKFPAVRHAVKGLVFLPLFSRVDKDAALDHPVRATIVSAIEHNPGIHGLELQRRTGVSRGALEHHLKKLRQVGLVTAEESAGFTCYFLKNSADEAERRASPALKGPRAEPVLQYVGTHPGTSLISIAHALSLTPAGVHYHLQRLERAGLVRMEKGPRQLRIFPTAGAAKVVPMGRAAA